MSREPLFTVTNHHIAEMGMPPHITDQTGTYRSYFENDLGDQFVFVYDRASQQGVLYCGDYDWEKPAIVRDGTTVELTLDETERVWLATCWAAATHTRVTDVLLRQAQVTETYKRRIARHLREARAAHTEVTDTEQLFREAERRLQTETQ